jgi:transcriptional antiterminator NusG
VIDDPNIPIPQPSPTAEATTPGAAPPAAPAEEAIAMPTPPMHTEPPESIPPSIESAAQAAEEELLEIAPPEAVGAVAEPAAAAAPEALSAEVVSPAKPVAKAPPREPAPPPPATQPVGEVPKSDKMDWYILKVQSNREESIREGLRRRIVIAGLDPFFGDIIIPTEKVTEFKAGKRKVFKRKLYPGYLVVQMEINEDTWFLVRETPGIGDFTGAAGHPTPMLAREVAAIRAKQEEKADEAPKLKINFNVGDHVKIKEGTFENFEGEVANIDETNGRVTVLINIFGRSTPVDIEYWQIEAV